MNENTTTAEATATPEVVTVDKVFGNGRYSAIAKELYRDSKNLLGLSEPQAIRLAKSYSDQLGRLNAQVTSVTTGKLSKDGTVTLREVAKLKNVHMTYALSLAKLCVQLQDAKANGAESFDVTLSVPYMEWLNNTK